MKKMQNNKQNKHNKNTDQKQQQNNTDNNNNNNIIMRLTPIKYAPQTPQHDNSEVGPMPMISCPSAPRPTSSCSNVAAIGPLFPCLEAECRGGQAALNIHNKQKIHKKQHYSAKRRIPVPVLTLKPRLSRHSSTTNNKFSVVVTSAVDMVSSSKPSSKSKSGVVFNKSILPTQQEKGRSSLHFDDRSGEISLLLSAA